MARALKVLNSKIQVESFCTNLGGWIMSALECGKSVLVTAVTSDEPDFDTEKSDSQRKKFHVMIRDIQRTAVLQIQGGEILLSDYSIRKCKSLLVVWFANEAEESGIYIPNPPESFQCPITGESITVAPSTTRWGKKLTCDFVEWLYAIGASTGVIWSDESIQAYQYYQAYGGGK